MESRFRWALSVFLVAVVAVASGAPARAETAPYRLCRHTGAGRYCVEFREGCDGGLYRTAGGTRTSCASLDKDSCAALTHLVQSSADELRAMDPSTRDSDRAGGISCDGYSLRVPGHVIYACDDRHPRATGELFRLFKAIEVNCEGN
jgi:hypothetical protein